MTCNWQNGLAISSPIGSSFTFDPMDPDDNVLGTNEDEEYFEYLFTLLNVTCADDGTCDTYAPASIRVTGEEQYFTLWICDSTTERISVRNATAEFKVGETVTTSGGATGTVKEWHNFREPNGLDIIEFETGCTGNFPSQVVTGSESGATADCIAGWFDTPGQTSLATTPPLLINTEVVLASVSGFYAYPKKVSYTKYLSPKCDTLVDVCGPIASYDDSGVGWNEMFQNAGNCETKKFAKEVADSLKDVWGATEQSCSRESTWPINADTGVYVKVPLLGEDLDGKPVEMKEMQHTKLQDQLETGWKNWFNAANGCYNNQFANEQTFTNLYKGLSQPTDLTVNREFVIDSAEETKIGMMDAGLEPDRINSAEMWREVRTFNCEMNDVIDLQIAMAEHQDAIFNNNKTVVPSNWYVEKMQEWSTHSFRGVPNAGTRIKWNIFEYVPHQMGRQSFPYTITGQWYCADLLGLNVGVTGGYSWTIPLEINSNWSTYRDLLAEAVERQGNPYDDVKIATLKEFIKPSDSAIKIFDYDAATFPHYGYIELNNYEYAGQGITDITSLDPGLGYMHQPIVTLTPPDLEGGVQATAEAIVTGGRVYGYKITNEGSGYIQSPVIEVETPNSVLNALADVTVGSSYIINITMSDYPKLFMGITVRDDGNQMDLNEVRRLVPAVDFDCTADGSSTIIINTIYSQGDGYDIDDIQAGMIVEGFDDPTTYVQSVSIAGNSVTLSQNIPAGSYRVNTMMAIQMDTASNVTLTQVNFSFTAPQTANATAYSRLFLQAETGSSFTYENSREIAHFDGKTANEDGSVTLNNVLRNRKETTTLQHLRNDHTFLHIYV
tara:strand:+ start:698 stop:3208 length:2511 start_codon:yes stop_codon:yes gene_type:complete